MPPRRYRLLILPIVISLLMSLLLWAAPSLVGWIDAHHSPAASEAVHAVAESLFWLALAFLSLRLIDVFLWDTVARRSRKAPPKLLVAVIRLLILVSAATVIAAVVFHQPLTGLAVSSGVLGIVLGFALQRMISDFFSGIALSMEHPFSPGDWIEVDGVTGRVVETNWRATHMVTLEHVTVVVPNSVIAERRFQNYSLPQPFFRTQIAVALEYSVSTADAKRVLLAATKATDGVLTQPAPDVLLTEFAQHGAVYTVRFFVADYGAMMLVRDGVAVSVSRQLYHAGIGVAFPKRDVFHAPMPPRQISRKTDRETLLARVELFEALEPGDLAVMAAGMAERRCRAGEDVVRQGEAGASLFVVVDGLLEARVRAGEDMMLVGRISPGEFFGEMSMLTGSPRGATVTAATDVTLYEISKDVISPILLRRPQLAAALSESIAQRRVRNDKALVNKDESVRAHHQRTFAQEVIAGIRSFFGLAA